MKKILFIISLLVCSIAQTQNKKAAEILTEGKLLFRLEKGSWYGTDHFLKFYKSHVDSIGGYLSYETSNHKIRTIFYNRYKKNDIMARYEFDSLPKPAPQHIDIDNKQATELEKSLIAMRKTAMDVVYSNKKRHFKFYENTQLNFIPLIRGKKRDVFILTASKNEPVVLIGNDYKLGFNKKNKIVKTEKFHKTLLKFPFTSKEKDNPLTTTTYASVLNKYITSTDICSLLLYKNYVEWKQQVVISKKYVSIFDLKKELLVIMKLKDWKKISQ